MSVLPATASRAGFLRTTGALGAGLALGFMLPGCATRAAAETDFRPNAWVRIAPDDTVTVTLSKSEMGQGVATGLPTILADELDASMAQVRFEFALADPIYADALFGNTMNTGGSTSIADSWLLLRRAGATARAMLIGAAAQTWRVEPATCTARAGSVYHDATKRSLTYGALAGAAAALPVPANVPLKKPAAFTIIGKPQQRLDIPMKVNGTAKYGIDTVVPGMKYAAIARSPVFGATVQHVDARKAKAVRGVSDVVAVSTGMAVIASNTWAAFQGKLALDITWSRSPTADTSTASMFAQMESLAKTRTGEHVAISRGAPNTTHGKVLEATYRGPFLAHATMEPMNTTADVRSDRCEVWSPNQVQTRAQDAAMAVTGFAREKCVIHTTLLGGGFGRRLEIDYVTEAVEVSKAIGAPVKLTWTREDDIQHDFCRPMSVNVIRGVIADGTVSALAHQVVSPSWMRRWAPPLVKNGIDPIALGEVLDAPYDVPNFRVSYIDYEPGIPIGSWRAPDANWNGFVTESFMDELAHAAGQDPLTFRLALMAKHPRAAAVLRLAAERAGWGKPHPGIKQGLAVTFWAGSYGAMVADVSMQGGKPKVHRVVAAVDCGTVVNPDIVVQQAQGATNYGLSAALTGNITIDHGRVTQNNFYDYTVLRMADAPRIEVHVVPSSETPTGIGEICTPPIAPAVGNAIFALTGKRIRQLPFNLS